MSTLQIFATLEADRVPVLVIQGITAGILLQQRTGSSYCLQFRTDHVPTVSYRVRQAVITFCSHRSPTYKLVDANELALGTCGY